MRSRQVPNSNICLSSLLLVALLVGLGQCNPEAITLDSTAVSSESELFTLYGKVNIRKDELDVENTRVLVDDGKYVAFLKADGTFTIPGLESNSYVVEVVSPRNDYEPVRIDVNSKGKVRTR